MASTNVGHTVQPELVASPPRYLTGIDGIRAFAVMAVLWFHAGHMSGGFLGVDAFFVISGFLITRQMLQEIDRTGRVALGQFFARRVRRLLPALALVLAVVAVVATLWGTVPGRLAFREDAPYALGFVLNWRHIADSADYWNALAAPSPLTHLWSLSVEEQFYIFWPLAVIVLLKLRGGIDRLVAIAAAVICVASFGLMAVLFDPAASTRVYEGTDTRMGGLLIGALCATRLATHFATRFTAAIGRWRDVLVVGLVVVLMWMWARVNGTDAWLYRYGLLIHALMVAALVVLLAVPNTVRWFAAGLSVAWLRWIGQRSYGLYLWHWPVYVALTPDRTGLGRWPLTFVQVGVSFVFAALSYALVEHPIRAVLQRRPATRTITVGTSIVAAMALLFVVLPSPSTGAAQVDVGSLQNMAAITTTTTLPDPVPLSTMPPGSPSPSPDPEQPVIGTTNDPESSTDPGSTADTVSTTDSTSSAPATTVSSTVPATTMPSRVVNSIWWFGDSIAFTTAPGIVAGFDAAGIKVKDGSFPGVGLLNETADAFFEQIEWKVASDPPDLVLFQLSSWDENYPAADQDEAMDRLHTIVAAAGADLIFIPIPPLDPSQDSDGFEAIEGAAERLVARYPLDTSLLSTTPFWGTAFDIDLNDDKVPERMYDGVHLCPSGSAAFALWLAGALGERYPNVTVADPVLWAGGDWTNDGRFDRLDGACAPLP